MDDVDDVPAMGLSAFSMLSKVSATHLCLLVVDQTKIHFLQRLLMIQKTKKRMSPQTSTMNQTRTRVMRLQTMPEMMLRRKRKG